MGGGAAIVDELGCGGCGGEILGVDFAVAEEEEGVAIAEEERGVARADDGGLRGGGERLDNDLDRRGALEVRWVGGVAVGAGFGSVGVGDGGGVGRPG